MKKIKVEKLNSLPDTYQIKSNHILKPNTNENNYQKYEFNLKKNQHIQQNLHSRDNLDYLEFNSTISRITQSEVNHHDQTGIDLLIEMCLKNGKQARQLLAYQKAFDFKQKIKITIQTLLDSIYKLEKQNSDVKKYIKEELYVFKQQFKKMDNHMKQLMCKEIKIISNKTQQISKLTMENKNLKRQLANSQKMNEQLKSRIFNLQNNKNKQNDINKVIINKHQNNYRHQQANNNNSLVRSYSIQNKFTQSARVNRKLDEDIDNQTSIKGNSSTNLLYIDVRKSHQFGKVNISSKTQQIDQQSQEYIDQSSRRLSGLCEYEKNQEGVNRRQKFKKLVQQKNNRQRLQRKNTAKPYLTHQTTNNEDLIFRNKLIKAVKIPHLSGNIEPINPQFIESSDIETFLKSKASSVEKKYIRSKKTQLKGKNNDLKK